MKELTEEDLREILKYVREHSEDEVTDGDAEPASEEPTDGKTPE